MTPKIYILLPVHNRCAITAQFIDCLATQTHTNYHLILIDDGSTDGTDQMVRAKIKNLTVLRGDGNWWWAGSLQQGINWLKKNHVDGQDIVMFSNDDITFDTKFLQQATSILGGLSSTLLLAQTTDEKTGHPQESGVEADLQKFTFSAATSPEKINCMPTRGLFMRMTDLMRIGDFHPFLLPHYLSDYEFTIRAGKKGLKLVTSIALTIGFDRAQTGFRDLESLGYRGFIQRYFSKKYVNNPIYWSTFIILAVPMPNKLRHLFRVWVGALKTVLLRSASSFRKQFCT
jgi:GT2 family glycosyltransferase